MKQQILKFGILAFTSFSILACSNDDDQGDTTKPSITINTPSEDQHYHLGEEISFNADFSDNVALASYKIEIHHAGDGHSHKNENNAEWYYVHTSTIDGNVKNFNATQTINIPTEISGEPIEVGHYHLGVFLIDAAGNEQQKFMEIEID